jgi:hypothetical protein
MFKRMTAAVAGLILCAAWADAPPAPPAKVGTLTFVGSKSGRGWFYAKQTLKTKGDAAEFWMVMAQRNPVNVDGHTVIGAWIHEKADCKARTLSDDLLITIDDKYAQATRDDRVFPPETVVAGSLGQERLDLACSAMTPKSGGPTVKGVEGAHAFVKDKL